MRKREFKKLVEAVAKARYPNVLVWPCTVEEHVRAMVADARCPTCLMGEKVKWYVP